MYTVRLIEKKAKVSSQSEQSSSVSRVPVRIFIHRKNFVFISNHQKSGYDNCWCLF